MAIYHPVIKHYEIKLNFSKFNSSNNENQTREESTSTEGMFNTIIERIYHFTLD